MDKKTNGIICLFVCGILYGITGGDFIMESKYNMTKDDNIFFAKRKLIDNLYKSANLEGIAVTFDDVAYFINNVNTGKISIDDMLKLKGLKDSWEYVLNTIDNDLTMDYIKRIHLERSITLFCWIQRSQMFLDGNKRVANLVANKEMIRTGQGILAVPVEKIGEYFTVLISFYESNDYTNIKQWIYDNCIDGINE